MNGPHYQICTPRSINPSCPTSIQIHLNFHKSRHVEDIMFGLNCLHRSRNGIKIIRILNAMICGRRGLIIWRLVESHPLCRPATPELRLLWLSVKTTTISSILISPSRLGGTYWQSSKP